jgi:hypothetical protein
MKMGTGDFIKKHWKWILLAIIIIIIAIIYYKRRENENGFEGETPCMDCGSGGMLGSGGYKIPTEENQIMIGEDTEKQIMSNPDTASTYMEFKQLFDGGKICDFETLKQKGKQNGLLILSSDENHIMEFNPKRIIIEIAQTKCGDKCPMMYGVVSIG